MKRKRHRNPSNNTLLLIGGAAVAAYVLTRPKAVVMDGYEECTPLPYNPNRLALRGPQQCRDGTWYNADNMYAVSPCLNHGGLACLTE